MENEKIENAQQSENQIEDAIYEQMKGLVDTEPKEENTENTDDTKVVEKAVEVTDDEVNKLLSDDDALKEFDTLVNAGFTPDEAREKVYGKANEAQEPQRSEVNTDYLISQDRYDTMVKEYENPTFKTLEVFVKNDPELSSIYGNDFTTDELKTAIQNEPTLKLLLLDRFRERLLPEIQKVQNAYATQNENRKANENLVQKLEDDFLQSFPELKENNKETAVLITHFNNRVISKITKLSTKEQQNPETIEKIYAKEKENFIKVLPALKNKFGIATKNQDALNTIKIEQMQQMSTTSTGGGNAKNVLRPDSTQEEEDTIIDAYLKQNLS